MNGFKMMVGVHFIHIYSVNFQVSWKFPGRSTWLLAVIGLIKVIPIPLEEKKKHNVKKRL